MPLVGRGVGCSVGTFVGFADGGCVPSQTPYGEMRVPVQVPVGRSMILSITSVVIQEVSTCGFALSFICFMSSWSSPW